MNAPSDGPPTPDRTQPEIHIEARHIAPRLSLATAEFRQLMAEGRIAVLCERGTGEDEGLYRATFYFGERRTRLVVDQAGNPVGTPTDEAGHDR